MKTQIKAAVMLLGAVVLTGCATSDYSQYSKAQTDIATAKHNADAEKYKAFAAIAQQGDATAKVAAVMAMAFGSGNTANQTAIQAPQPNQALQWASILVPGLTQVAGMRYNYLSQQIASNNATSLGLSTNNAFVGLAAKIQAPGSTTTTTLSGTGNLGSGTYGFTDSNNTSTSPVITPVVQVVPNVITPVVQVTPTVITPVVNSIAAPVVSP